MNILSRDDLLLAESKGDLRVKDRLDFSAFSLDVRIEKLFRRNESKALQFQEFDLNEERFIEEVLEEVPIDGGGYVLESGGFYLWQPQEEIFLSCGLRGEIVTRSSWARLGIRVSSLGGDSDLANEVKDITTKPLGIISTQATRVKIKKGDSMGQLIVGYGDSRINNEEIKEMVRKNQLTIVRYSKKMSVEKLKFHGHLVLTMAPEIYIYNGAILTPSEDNSHAFEKIQLHYTQRHYLKKGDFFISCSAEYVAIPPKYVGLVTEVNSHATNSQFAKTNDPRLMVAPFTSHPNCPYIGPKGVFEGQITFENIMWVDSYVTAGMKQSELMLKELTRIIEVKSRYNEQKGATFSRL
jgi:deoxycytidine triphosphate deaminase